MKKIILTAAAVFALTFANAQDSKARFGAILGGNLSSVTENSDANNLFSYHVGALMEYKFADKWAFQPEVMYSAQGSKADLSEPALGIDETFTMNLNYINVPLMAKFYPTEKFNIQAGPQIGFLTSAKVKGMGEEEDIKDITKSTNFGVNFGVGYDFTENVFAQVRYNMGLTDTGKDDELHSKNSVFQLSVGYIF